MEIKKYIYTQWFMILILGVVGSLIIADTIVHSPSEIVGYLIGVIIIIAGFTI